MSKNKNITHVNTYNLCVWSILVCAEKECMYIYWYTHTLLCRVRESEMRLERVRFLIADRVGLGPKDSFFLGFFCQLSTSLFVPPFQCPTRPFAKIFSFSSHYWISHPQYTQYIIQHLSYLLRVFYNVLNLLFISLLFLKSFGGYVYLFKNVHFLNPF